MWRTKSWPAMAVAAATAAAVIGWPGAAHAQGSAWGDQQWNGGGVRPAAPGSATRTGTVEESLAVSLQRTEISDTRSSDLDEVDEMHRTIESAMAAADPPQQILDACLAHENAGKPGGHVYNRYVWCERNSIRGETFKVPPGEFSGAFVLPYRAIALASPFSRQVHYFFHADDEETLGKFTSSSPLSIRVGCQDLDVGCSADIGEVTHDIGDWPDQGWVDWNFGSDENASPQTPEKVLRNNFASNGNAVDDAGIEVDLKGASRPNFRCDSASYFPTRACVFTDVIPRLNYVYGNGYNEVVDHIRLAQDHPDQTHPPQIGKTIPGRYPPPALDTGLFRVEYRGATWKKNGTAKDAACATLPPPASGQDCDEYPFASTKQGAALGDGNFSVRYVDAGQNRSAGGALPAYYLWDRILYWDSVTRPPLDEFWVKAG
jgi:hypothetical protein